jgi:selenide,water dikinase
VFGLCVLGFVHPARVWRKAGARAGDALMLSKPLGTGVLVSCGEREALRVAVESMRITNQAAARALQALPAGPHAVTDVSGYGLLGHAREMAAQSSVVLRLDAARVPLLEGALRLARDGVRTSLHRRTGTADAVSLRLPAGFDQALLALLQDPQTSGGLLAAVAPQHVEALQRDGFHRIGRVEAGAPAVTLEEVTPG